MSARASLRSSIAVVKIGGSVLTGPAAYRQAAAFISQRLLDNPGERLVVVVSAEFGATDALLDTARDIVAEPDPGTLDLLWSTGEIRSAALFALSLHALGIRAAAANVHQTGLTHDGHFRPLRLHALLATHEVVVAPGFLARGDADCVVSLGRGGSDLTAVLLASGLGAARCELVKDVAGYFSADPHVDPAARHLPELSFASALAMAADGCELVQQQALEAAEARGLPLVVRALHAPTFTVLSKQGEFQRGQSPVIDRGDSPLLPKGTVPSDRPLGDSPLLSVGTVPDDRPWGQSPDSSLH